MCVSPVKIPNPNYKSKVAIIQKTTDTLNQYLYVPCNVCPECLMSRQGSLVQRARNMALDHYIFFCTLTYNRESLPVYDCVYDKVNEDGSKIHKEYHIPYADISDVQKMFKRIRISKSIPRDWSYFFVSERGTDKGRPHFHGLIFIPKLIDDDKLYPAILETSLRKLILSEWKRNYGSDRSPIWKPLLTYRVKYVAGKRISNYDLHYVVNHSTEKGSDDVAFYVTKYILKPSAKEARLQQALRLNLDEDFYNEVWSVVRSRSFCSKHFGARSDKQVSYVKSCIEKSKTDPSGLKYFNSDGSPFPLSRYYRKYLSLDACITSVAARGGPVYEDDRSITEKIQSVQHGSAILQKARKRDISELYPIDD